MVKKSNTIYQDLEKIKTAYESLQERAMQDHKRIEDYNVKEILEELKVFKDMFHESGTIVADLFLEDKENLFDSELAEWNALHKEYRDICKFIDKWSSKQNETVKQAKSSKILDKKEILKTLDKGTKINITKYGIVELIQVNRTRFYAIYNGQEWSFPIENFIEVIN